MDDNKALAVRPMTALALVIVRLLEGLGLSDADRALDDARRAAWRTIWVGDDAAENVNNPRIGEVLKVLVGRSPSEINNIVFEARLALWMEAFMDKPDTRFGRKVAEFSMVEAAGKPLN